MKEGKNREMERERQERERGKKRGRGKESINVDNKWPSVHFGQWRVAKKM